MSHDHKGDKLEREPLKALLLFCMIDNSYLIKGQSA